MNVLSSDRGSVALQVLNVLADNERMTGLRIVRTTQEWRRVPNGEFWQRCVARTADGSLVWVLVPDELLGRAA